MFKKGISLILSLLMTFSLCANVRAADLIDSGSDIIITSLGDSIPAAYGVEEQEGYIALLSDMLSEASISNKVTNYAVSGYETSELLTQLDKADVKRNVAKSNVITISIGGNDILKQFTTYVTAEAKKYGVRDLTKINFASLIFYHSLLMKKDLPENIQNEIENSIAAFTKNWEPILAKLKTLAPNAKILVSTIYNPIQKGIHLYDLADSHISQINTALIFGQEAGGYTVVDIYNIFKDKAELTNFDLTKGSIDIHPSKAGHIVIAQEYKEAVDGLLGEK